MWCLQIAAVLRNPLTEEEDEGRWRTKYTKQIRELKEQVGEIKEQNDKMEKQNAELKEQNAEFKEQNAELKEILIRVLRPPQKLPAPRHGGAIDALNV